MMTCNTNSDMYLLRDRAEKILISTANNIDSYTSIFNRKYAVEASKLPAKINELPQSYSHYKIEKKYRLDMVTHRLVETENKSPDVTVIINGKIVHGDFYTSNKKKSFWNAGVPQEIIVQYYCGNTISKFVFNLDQRPGEIPPGIK